MTMTTRVQSVSIPVADQDRALAFYTQVLGCELRTDIGAMIFLAAAGLTGHDDDDESPERVDPGGRSGPGTGVLHTGARLRAAHRYRCDDFPGGRRSYRA